MLVALSTMHLFSAVLEMMLGRLALVRLGTFFSNSRCGLYFANGMTYAISFYPGPKQVAVESVENVTETPGMSILSKRQKSKYARLQPPPLLLLPWPLLRLRARRFPPSVVRRAVPLPQPLG